MGQLIHFKEILLVLATAGLVIPILLRFGVSPSLGYLLVGILLGPHVVGQLAQQFPALAPFNLGAGGSVSGFAELGIVFLMFLVGLELSFERLKTMKRLVFGMGGAQMGLSMAAIGLASWWLGFDARQSAVLAMALAMSSTALVIQHLSDTKRLGSQAGRASFAVLLFQDLSVIPALMLVGLLAANTQSSLALDVVRALAQAAAAVAVIVLVGRVAMRPLLKFVASTKSTDLFMAAVLLIAVGTGVLANMAGLSMALGAFIAGLMLAETEYRRAVETIIEPFKGILLGVFFLLVGLQLDLPSLAADWPKIIMTTIALIAGKALIVFVLARVYGVQRGSALETAMLLGPSGEFAFVILAAASTAGLLGTGQGSAATLLVTLSMMSIPFLARMAPWVRTRLATPGPSLANAEPPPVGLADHVIIAGYGRVGALVADVLKEQNIPSLAIDGDPNIVTRQYADGRKVYFGDASNIAFLRKCGLARAKALAVTMDSPTKAGEIVRVAHAEHPGLKIVVRARDERHAMKMYEAGATEAVPETIEASLQLAEALLVETGVPMGLAIAAIHERRDQFRKLLGTPNRREQVKSMRARFKQRLP